MYVFINNKRRGECVTKLKIHCERKVFIAKSTIRQSIVKKVRLQLKVR